MITLRSAVLLLSLTMGASSLIGCEDKSGADKKGSDDDKGSEDDGESKDKGLLVTVPDAKLDAFKLKASHAEFTFLNGTKTKDKEVQYAPIARVYLSDDELERGAPKGDGVLVYMSLKGEYGDDAKGTKISKGTYKPGGEKLNVEIEIKKGGETFSLRKAKGEVEVTSASEGKVAGKIDIKEGDIVIKGPFKAKSK